VAELPLEHNPLPLELIEQIQESGSLCVAEEHVARGSFASELALNLMELGTSPRRFVHLFARAHYYERYGSQAYLRKQSRLDPASLLAAIQF
jgi:transketolase